MSVFLPPEWVKTVRDESGGNRPDEPPVRPDGPADKPAPAPAEAAGAAVPDGAPSPGSPERPSSVGTGIPSTRWPHHSTTPHTWNGTQPCPFRCSGGSVTSGISLPHVGHGRIA